MPPPDDALKTNEQRIAWILAHPRTSAWLKDALRGARQRDPVELLNELEILNLLLRNDCDVRIRAGLLVSERKADRSRDPEEAD
ncbi:hypothetical protein [Reyranella sp.]|uniref:hypothetical protein n=1 Tax=Reyranella sp. TaxID=1929291 RepID=UPI003C7B7B65